MQFNLISFFFFVLGIFARARNPQCPIPTYCNNWVRNDCLGPPVVGVTADKRYKIFYEPCAACDDPRIVKFYEACGCPHDNEIDCNIGPVCKVFSPYSTIKPTVYDLMCPECKTVDDLFIVGLCPKFRGPLDDEEPN